MPSLSINWAGTSADNSPGFTLKNKRHSSTRWKPDKVWLEVRYVIHECRFCYHSRHPGIAL